MSQKDIVSDVRERRCIITGESDPATGMVRLVMGPEDILVPDLAERLPGRGLWISADGALIAAAAKDGRLIKGASRSLKVGVKPSAVPDELDALIESLLAKRILDRLGLERRAGRLVIGFEKVRASLGDQHKAVVALITASDASDDGRDKLKAKALGVPSQSSCRMVEFFDRDELSQALGRNNVVHAAVLSGGRGKPLLADIDRLSGFRGTTSIMTDQKD